MGFLYLFISLFSILPTWAKDHDPYAQFEYRELPNKLKVYLAPQPQANTIDFMVKIGVGYAHEKKSEKSLYHVLEHMLFRNDILPKNMSYLQHIQEKGGRANGMTSAYNTYYYATMNPEKREWLIDSFHTMLFKHNFREEYVKHAKREVLIEIGEERNLFQEFLHFFTPVKIEVPSFWETEFGYEDVEYDQNDERKNVPRLKLETIRKGYEWYYHTSNITIFISGKFNKEKVWKQIEKTFGALTAKTDPQFPEHPRPQSNEKEYSRSKVASNHPSMTMGVKFSNIDFNDYLILKVYLEYLSHKLMKKIRNLHSDTYSVVPETKSFYGSGIGHISLSTPNEKFSFYKKMIEDELSTGPYQGKVSKEDFEKAIELYQKNFKLLQSSSRQALTMIDQLDIFKNYFQIGDQSPYAVFKSLDYQAYNKRLKVLFAKKNRISFYSTPPLLFRYDHILFAAIIIFLTVQLFKRVIKKKFNHTQIALIRKIKFSPVSLIFSCFLLTLVLSLHSVWEYALNRIWYWTNLKAYSFTNFYVQDAFEYMFLTLSFMIYLSLLPRKMIVRNRELLIKSVSYFSKSLPLEEIHSVQLLSTWEALKKANITTSFWYWGLMDKGILIEMRNGKKYFYKTSNSKETFNELTEILKTVFSSDNDEANSQLNLVTQVQ